MAAKFTRLRKREEFATVLNKGERWSNNLLVLGAHRNDLDAVRCGVSVSKRLGNAVQRNRIKRRLREALRGLCPLNGWDLVLIPRKGAAEASYKSLKGALEQLLRRGGLMLYPLASYWLRVVA